MGGFYHDAAGQTNAAGCASRLAVKIDVGGLAP
jgi:hypothetical protein